MAKRRTTKYMAADISAVPPTAQTLKAAKIRHPTEPILNKVVALSSPDDVELATKHRTLEWFLGAERNGALTIKQIARIADKLGFDFVYELSARSDSSSVFQRQFVPRQRAQLGTVAAPRARRPVDELVRSHPDITVQELQLTPRLNRISYCSRSAHITSRGFLVLNAVLVAFPNPLDFERLAEEAWQERDIPHVSVKVMISKVNKILRQIGFPQVIVYRKSEGVFLTQKPEALNDSSKRSQGLEG